MKSCTCNCHLKILAVALSSLFAVANGSYLSFRKLLQASEYQEGRATWYDSPQFGSCGYGKLDTVYKFGYDAVAAFPDVMMGYAGSCGRCYEIKCRGAQVKSADGTINLDRFDACIDENKSIVIKIVDTCPCKGNEKWCCGDENHFDLGKQAFARLSDPAEGIIGLSWRAVPCSAAFAPNGTASPEDEKKLENDLALGASSEIFVNGDIGIGWIKTVYGDALMSMFTYDSSLFELEDGSIALCNEFDQYGGFSFTAMKPISTFAVSKGLEFFVKTDNNSVPDMVVRLSNQIEGACMKDLKLEDGKTADSTQGGWVRYFFPISSFECTGPVSVNDVDRVQWESRGQGKTSLCVKDIRLVPQDQSTFAAAGR